MTVVRDQSLPSAPESALRPDPTLRPNLAVRIAEIAGVVGAWCPSLSPAGDRIAYVTDRSGLPRLEVAHLDRSGEHADATPRTVSLPDQEIVSVAWSPDGQWLAYLVSPDGLIRAELHAIRPDGTDARVLAGTGPLATVFAGCWTTIPNTYAFSLADGTGPDADVCLVDVTTGVIRRLTRGGFHTVTSVSPDGRRFLARRGPRGRRHLVLGEIPDPCLGGDSGPVHPVHLLATDSSSPGTALAEDGRFSAEGRAVFVRTAAGRDRLALGMVELDDDGRPGPLRLLAGRDDADLESYAVLGAGRRTLTPPTPRASTAAGPAAAGDDALAADIGSAAASAAPDPVEALLIWNVDGVSDIEVAALPTCPAGDGGMLERASYRVDIGAKVTPGWTVHRDGLSGILELTEPVAPRSLYHVDLVHPGVDAPPVQTPQRITGLPVPDLAAGDLVPPTSVHYRSHDGLPLQGLLYRPPGVTGATPTVVLLHGGPESQERPAFSILIQSLAAAGIAVFAPNVRGSTGFGLEFTAMDDLERREDSFQDITATVDHLVACGVATPGRLGVHGWSYGGYLALVAVSRWPGLFASGSSHAGMSDLHGFFAETEPWMAAASVTEYGDPVQDAELLTALSPIHLFHRVLAPTLLVHGTQDTNVPVGESVRAHRALRAAGVPTDLLLLPGEGHTIVGRDARIASTRAIVEWHARWLG